MQRRRSAARTWETNRATNSAMPPRPPTASAVLSVGSSESTGGLAAPVGASAGAARAAGACVVDSRTGHTFSNAGGLLPTALRCEQQRQAATSVPGCRRRWLRWRRCSCKPRQGGSSLLRACEHASSLRGRTEGQMGARGAVSPTWARIAARAVALSQAAWPAAVSGSRSCGFARGRVPAGLGGPRDRPVGRAGALPRHQLRCPNACMVQKLPERNAGLRLGHHTAAAPAARPVGHLVHGASLGCANFPLLLNLGTSYPRADARHTLYH